MERKNGFMSRRLYKKRDYLNLHDVNYPCLDSYIPTGPACGVYISIYLIYNQSAPKIHILFVGNLCSCMIHKLNSLEVNENIPSVFPRSLTTVDRCSQYVLYERLF